MERSPDLAFAEQLGLERREAAGVSYVHGGSGPNLVLLHGGVASWLHWARNIKDLSRRFSVYALDLPGMGRSTDVPQDADIDAFAALLLGGLDAIFESGQQFHLGAFSLGGLMGAVVAARRPDRVLGLSMVMPGGFRPGEVNRIATRSVCAGMDDEQIRDVHRHNLAQLMLTPAAIDEDAVTIQRYNIEHARFNGRRIAYGDHLGRFLPDVVCPVQLLIGERDPLPAPSVAARVAYVRELSPDCEVHVVPNAGHWLIYERPDVANTLIADFLDRAA